MATVGSGDYVYEPVENWAKLPPAWSFKEIGAVGSIATTTFMSLIGANTR